MTYFFFGIFFLGGLPESLEPLIRSDNIIFPLALDMTGRRDYPGCVKQDWERRAAPGAVFVAVCAVYARCLDYPLVRMLDVAVLEDRIFRLTLGRQLQRVFIERLTFGGEFLPLTMLTLVLQRAAGLWQPFWLHAVNVAFHAGAAAAVCALGERIYAAASPSASGRRGAASAAAAALFFALHPLRVEAVAWISARMYPMMGLFCALSALAHIEAAGARTWTRSLAWRLASLAGFGAALLSYGVSAPLPLALLALDAYPLRRLRRRPAWALLAEKLPYFALAALALGYALYGRYLDGHVLGPGLTGPRDWAASLFAFSYYLQKTAVPIGLSYSYYPACSSSLYPGAYLAGGLAFAAACLCWRRKELRPGLMCAAASYAAMLLPFIGLVRFDHPEFAVADRWSYLPSIPLALGLGAALLAWPRLRSRVARACLGAELVLLSAASLRQESYWRSHESLVRHALDCSPECAPVKAWLVKELSLQGRGDEARQVCSSISQSDKSDPLVRLLGGSCDAPPSASR